MKNRIKEFKIKPVKQNKIEERKKAPQPIIVNSEVLKEKEIVIKQKPIVNIEEINRIKLGLTVKNSKAPSLIETQSLNEIDDTNVIENKSIMAENNPVIENQERLTKSSRGRPTIIKEQKSNKVILRFVENSFEQY